MTPFGLNDRSTIFWVHGNNSEYILSSRSRRVVRCEYCELDFDKWYATKGSIDHSPKVENENCVKALVRFIVELAIRGHIAQASVLHSKEG